MTAPVVELVDVAKSYRTTADEAVVLRGIDLTLAPGEKASLVGPSGSGKSTLLGLMAGLLRPDRGSVRLDGQPLEHADDDRRARLRARHVGIALQSENLIPFLSAIENVELAMEFAGPQVERDRAADLLDRMGVAHRAHHRPRQLSGGEAQRVALAVALANQPTLLLVDEVAAQLDSSTAGQVVDALFEADIALLFVTHARDLADRAETRLRLVDHRLVRP